jgi:hypothetical protein
MSIDPTLAAYGITVDAVGTWHIPAGAGAAVTIVPIEGRLRELRIMLADGVVLKAKLHKVAVEFATEKTPLD